MNLKSEPLVNLYFLQALTKGMSVFYFVLLPLFYAEKFINSTQLGYIGGLFIVLLIVGAVIVSTYLHHMEIKKLLKIASILTICASFILLVGSLEKIFCYC
jgi:hypothetical protein